MKVQLVIVLLIILTVALYIVYFVCSKGINYQCNSTIKEYIPKYDESYYNSNEGF